MKKFIMVDVGFEPTTQETHGLSTTPFIKELLGYYYSPFDHLQNANQWLTQTKHYNTFPP